MSVLTICYTCYPNGANAILLEYRQKLQNYGKLFFTKGIKEFSNVNIPIFDVQNGWSNETKK